MGIYKIFSKNLGILIHVKQCFTQMCDDGREDKISTKIIHRSSELTVLNDHQMLNTSIRKLRILYGSSLRVERKKSHRVNFINNFVKTQVITIHLSALNKRLGEMQIGNVSLANE